MSNSSDGEVVSACCQISAAYAPGENVVCWTTPKPRSSREQPSTHIPSTRAGRAGACGDLHPHLDRRGAPAQLPGGPARAPGGVRVQSAGVGEQSALRGPVHGDRDRDPRSPGCWGTRGSAGSMCCWSTAWTGSHARSGGSRRSSRSSTRRAWYSARLQSPFDTARRQGG